MGWTDSHLHQFKRDGKKGVPQWDAFELNLLDESKTSLATVLTIEGDAMLYEYDFGDNWRHQVVLEKILPAEGTPEKPVCVDGDRRCPPEDVGGISGYGEFLKAVLDPKHKSHDRYVQWFGGHFVDGFDLAAVNDTLSQHAVARTT
jgi:hypothetical protein